MRLKHSFNNKYLFILLSLLIFLAGVSLAYRLALSQYKTDMSHERAVITAELDKARGMISRQIDSIIYLSQGLVSLVKIQHGITNNQFIAIAQEIITSENRIRNIALAPKNIVQFVYPVKGNERVLGLNYLKKPDQREAVLRSMHEKTTVIAGPVELIQGGLGIISRTPIFLKSPPEYGGKLYYWGLASIVIDFNRLMKSTGLSENKDINILFALRGKDGTGAAGITFWGDGSIFDLQPVTMDITLPSGNWQMAALPAGGWTEFSPFKSVWFVFGSVISFVFSILFFQLIHINSLMRQEIMERLETEEALRKSEEQYRSIYENSVMGIFRTTPDGRYLSANPAGMRMYGYKSLEEMIHMVSDMAHQIYVHPEDRRRFKELLENNGLVEGFEAEHHTRSGKRIWVSMNSCVVRDLSGAILYYETTSEDITKRKQVEEELDKYHMHLEDLIRERTKELEQAKDDAQAADRLKSAFLATMSHELRTPLNSIIGFTGILIQGLVGQLNEEQKKQLGMVRNSANHLLSLINDVLDISKIEAGQLKVNHEPFDLYASIRKVEQTVRPLAEKKGLYLTVDIALDAGMIISDTRRVEQVLLNLLSNAVKFTEKGGITLTCSINNGMITTSITDTGVGIRDEEIDGLFKPFHQIDSGLSRKYEGTGLGLSICKKLVQLLGGDIRVESIWGKGSTFSFSLPVERGMS